MDLAQLKVKRRQAATRFSGIEGVEGFGVGDGTIRVYLRSADVKSKLPEDFDGIPFEFVVAGEFWPY